MASSKHTTTNQEITMANAIEVERRMAEDNVKEALNYLTDIDKTSEFGDILLHLRFLRTFVCCTAKGCFDYMSLPNVLALVKNVGLLVQKLALHSSEELEVAQVLEMLKHLQPQVEHAYFFMSQNTPAYRVFMWGRYHLRFSSVDVEIRDLQFLNYVSFLREDMRLLLQKRTDIVDDLRNEIDILHGNLIYIHGLLEVTSNIRPSHKRRHELFRHFQLIADKAAFLSYFCLADKMNEHRISGLTTQYSQLNMKIAPSAQEVRQLYITVLTILRSWCGTRSYLYPRIFFAENYVKVLIHITKEILKGKCGWVMYMKDGLEYLHVKLISLSYMVANRQGFILQDSEGTTAIDIGCLLLMNYNGEMNEEAVLSLTVLQESMRLQMPPVPRHINLESPNFSDLDDFDCFLRSLTEILGYSSSECILWNNHFQLIQKRLVSLRNFLSEISDNMDQGKRIKHTESQIMHVAYEAEYAIESMLLGDTTISQQVLCISDVIEKIRLIEAETNMVRCSNEMDDQEEHHDVQNNYSDEETRQHSIKEGRQILCFDEEETLLQSLCATSEGTGIVFITGMAGQGKSTLANIVFDDLSMNGVFDVCARCTVSQVYNKRSILIKFIKSVSGPDKDDGDLSTESYDDLELLLNQRLKKRKYLIFLDDIWEIDAWNKLKRSFPESDGSKILFTSRSDDLPFKVNANCKVIPLTPLSSKKSMELLKMKLFGNESFPLHLKELGDQIASRCKGLPLAIELVAGILQGKNELDLWNEVAGSPNAYILEDCKGVLDLSYNWLPYYLKSCFLYLGAFPEDKVITSKELIRLWIAEGYIIKTNGKSLERIAEDCLMELVTRNLISGRGKRSCGGIKEVYLHDLVLKYCLDKSEDEKFLHLIYSSADHTISASRRFAIPYVQGNTNWSRSSYPLVRSLVFTHRLLDGDFARCEVTSICEDLKSLRVLDLISIELNGEFPPSALFTLVHLRYLAICGTFNIFPASISKLSKLETLLVKHIGSGGVRLPSCLLSMTKLRQLQISKWFSLEGKVTLLELLEKLENLEIISTALLPHGRCPKENMKRFPKVKKLKCIFQKSGSILKKVKKLRVLDFLTGLESLNLSYKGYGAMGNMFDIGFPNCMTKLTLSGFQLPWEKVSTLGELQNLEVLKLLDESFEGERWELKDEMFPNVKYLKLEDLRFERWIPSEECEDHSYFPCLEQLELIKCWHLKEIPFGLGGIGYLRHIRVQRCFEISPDSIQVIEEEQRQLGNVEFTVQCDFITIKS